MVAAQRSVYRWWFLVLVRAGVVLAVGVAALSELFDGWGTGSSVILALSFVGAARTLSMCVIIDDSEVRVRNLFFTYRIPLSQVNSFGTRLDWLQLWSRAIAQRHASPWGNS